MLDCINVCKFFSKDMFVGAARIVLGGWFQKKVQLKKNSKCL